MKNPTTMASHRRDASLDSLRGLAIIYVLIGHYSRYLKYDVFGRPIDWYISGFGLGGVLLFFLLSGYLIYQQIQRQSPLVFANRRFFRIFPAYWLSILSIFLAGCLFADFPQFTGADYLANMFMIEGVVHKASLNGAYWTLIAEVEFYAAIAMLFFLLRRRFLGVFPFIAIALNVTLYVAFGRVSVILTYLPVFFFGIYLRRHRTGELPLHYLGAYLVVVMVNLALFQYYEKIAVVIFAAVNLATFLALVTAQYSHPILNFFGNISYSLYLFHTSLGYFLVDRLNQLFPAAGSAASVTISAVAMILLSYLSYRLFELPFIALGRSLEPKTAVAPAAPVAPARP